MNLIHWVIYTVYTGFTFHKDYSEQSSMGHHWYEPSTSVMMIVGDDNE